MDDLNKTDCVVIGAGILIPQRYEKLLTQYKGWHGLAAAKTYLELNPSAMLVVFDSASSVGGVWAKERLYPTLKSNNILGTYEYSDFPMTPEAYNVEPGQHIPGDIVHIYLQNYAEKFGVYERVRFDSKVEAAEHQHDGGWLITVSKNFKSSNVRQTSKLVTSKLIVATGMTSDPFLPHIPGSHKFEAPIFHPKDFLKNASTLETAGTIGVLGGTKSAWDVVYAYASKGHRVEWIIRESGHGPVWISPAYVTPLKKLLEKLVLTRFLTFFSPCIFGFADGFPRVRSFLHKTSLGRFLVERFWDILRNDLLTLNKFDSHTETAKLKPWSNPFFIGAGLSILNYPTDIYAFVRNGTVRVHIADIDSLDNRSTINLSSGKSFSVDTLVCCNGWKFNPPLLFFPAEADLGLPYKSKDLRHDNLCERADQEIFSDFPRLKNQPTPNPKFKPLLGKDEASKSDLGELQPYQLYRLLVPPKLIDMHDIAFSGCINTISTAICAQTQALWIAAYFNKCIRVSSNVEYESVLHSRWARWRSPVGFGARFPDLAFDSLPYIDLLLLDLGLQQHRKNGVFANVFSPYGPEDYKGLVNEWGLSTRKQD
jgi:cation diffusion facilitator CzcD-associated flavoprotein CzcO